MKSKTLLLILFLNTINSQSTWSMSGRVHPELKWETISTAHFNIHFHQGIEDIAKDGAVLAEHYRPTLLKQMELDTIPKIDIIFTTEDEIMNGFAMPTYQTFIWVDQNDAAIWLEKGKWLEQVLAHELQHLVYFHKIKTWMPQPFGYLFSGLPAWVAEGLAEYETESWRPYRADLSHKRHILKNTTNRMDPHHDGFSKMLYWADRYGDSTIAKTLGYRNQLKLYSFGTGFKKATGTSVKQFNEDWRRHMNTYYYGYRAQKESYNEIGETISLPIKRLQSFKFYSDSTLIAMLGIDDKDQGDVSLMIAQRDTAKETERYNNWEKRIDKIKKKDKKTKKDSLQLSKKFKEKVLWDKTEIDFGRFHEGLSWSADGTKLAYSKYHFDKNQSMVYDIKYYDKTMDKTLWLTKSMRASYPTWLDSNTVAFVSHKNSVSNIFSVNINDKKTTQLTSYTDNTQIAFLSVAPSSRRLLFSMSPINGNMDIYTMDLNSKQLNRHTTNEMADTYPVWHPDETAISYTSNANGVPNIHTINLSNNTRSVNTDAGDGIWTYQWMPSDSLLLARTLGDVDTVRLVKVSPFRSPDTKEISLRTNYTSWLSAGPDVSFVNEKPQQIPEISTSQKYRFTKHLRPLGSIILPGAGLTIWQDALGRHLFQAAGYLDRNIGGYALGYTNAEHGPLWGIGFFKNTDGSLRQYDGNNIIDINNGMFFEISHPFNSGESFSSNQAINFSTYFISHKIADFKTAFNDGDFISPDSSNFSNLPAPESGKEGYLSLRYTFTNKRPHAWDFLHPKQGYGFNANIDIASKEVFGMYSYTRLKTDTYFNINLKKVGGSILYFRLKTMASNGKLPAQKYIGLTDDQPLYINGIGDLSPLFPENHNPRGWSGYRLGDRMFFGSIEYRMPIVPKTLSLNLITDFANAWWSSGKAKEDMVLTAGYELRFSLGPLVIAGGDAQLVDDWENGKKPVRYYRLVLTTPF